MGGSRELRDFFIYVSVGGFVTAAVVFAAIYSADHNGSPYLPVWFWSSCSAAFVCFSAARRFWKYRKKTRLWLTLAVFAALHVVVYEYATGGLSKPPVVLVVLLLYPELVGVVFCLDWILRERPEQTRPLKGS